MWRRKRLRFSADFAAKKRRLRRSRLRRTLLRALRRHSLGGAPNRALPTNPLVGCFVERPSRLAPIHKSTTAHVDLRRSARLGARRSSRSPKCWLRCSKKWTTSQIASRGTPREHLRLLEDVASRKGRPRRSSWLRSRAQNPRPAGPLRSGDRSYASEATSTESRRSFRAKRLARPSREDVDPRRRVPHHDDIVVRSAGHVRGASTHGRVVDREDR